MIRKLISAVLLCVAVQLTAAEDPVEKIAKADAVVLLDEIRVDVDDAGTGTFDILRRVKIQTDVGAFDHRVVVFDYDPLTAFARFESAKIISADGKVRPIDVSKQLDYAAPARMIYWGARQIMLEIGRMEIGDVLEYTILKKGFTYALLDGGDKIAGTGSGGGAGTSEDESRFVPPMRGEFYDIIPFWSEKLPVAEKIYSVSIKKPLQYRFFNGAAETSVEFEENGKTRYTFISKDILPFEKEKNMVDLFDAAPKLFLSTTPSWREKSLWFCKVNEDFGSFNATDAAQNKVNEIIAGAKTGMEKISRLTHWVADNMRYSGISMGKGEGYTLHPTEMNFTDRCGVCKDKAALLISMLRMAGFEAFPAMTMAGSKVEKIPADHFNHSVVVVKLPDGIWMPLDPTWVPFVRELWSSAEQQQNYLPGIPGGSDLRETPISPAENHFFRISVEGAIDAAGTLSAEILITAEGQSDFRIRRPFVEGYVEDWTAKIEKELMSISPNVNIEKISLGNDWRDYLAMPIVLGVKVQIPNYAVLSDDVIVYEPIVFKNIFSAARRHETLDTKIEKRKYGFRDSCSRTVEFSEKITLPYDVAEYGQTEVTPGAAANFNGTLSAKERELSYSQKLVMNKRVYDPSDWADVRAALLANEKFSKHPVVLIRKKN